MIAAVLNPAVLEQLRGLESWDLVSLKSRNPGNWYVVDKSGALVADFPQVLEHDWDRQAKNIRLISACPDVLSALVQLYQQVLLAAPEVLTDGPGGKSVLAMFIEASVAKATGSES